MSNDLATLREAQFKLLRQLIDDAIGYVGSGEADLIAMGLRELSAALAILDRLEAQESREDEPVYQIRNKLDRKNGWGDVNEQLYEFTQRNPDFECRTLYTSKQALSAEGDTARLDALQQRKVSVNYGESMKYGSGFYWFVPGTKLTNQYAVDDVRQALDEAIAAQAQIKEQG